MGQDPSTGSPEVTGARDPEQIQNEIEHTREELGDTIEALAAKADVKAHVHERVQRTKASLPSPVVLGAVAAVVVAGLVAWRLKKRGS
jgi:hypothetical protein